MANLHFQKEDLINLEHSLQHELLRTNRSGAYASHTIVGCNTRKYHGLLVCPIPTLNNEQHVLLSALDVSLVYNNSEFNLGVRKYGGDVYHPGGHKYIQSFQAETIPTITYRIGEIVLKREAVLVENKQQILVAYTIEQADKPVTLKFTPFLAFRHIHSLSKANMYVNSKVQPLNNGVHACLYDDYPNLYMQLSKKNEFLQMPDWYYNVEYAKEQERGYDYCEDLYTPGYFELIAKEGETIVFSAGTSEAQPKQLKAMFKRELKHRVARNTAKNCLINSAQQFIVNTHDKTDLVAGYHWLNKNPRSTFVALPGLTLSVNNRAAFFEVIDSQLTEFKNGYFKLNSNEHRHIESADASLWFIWCLQQYYIKYGEANKLWNKYGREIKKILTAYQKASNENVYLLDNGLVYAGDEGFAMTWMDGVYAGRPITPRTGLAVEINALWYNALCFTLELASLSKDASFTRKWKHWPEKVAKSFLETFWNGEKAHLADVKSVNSTDWSIRPNQVIASSFVYSPLSTEMKEAVIKVADQHLLTPKGLRSLAPQNAKYVGHYLGSYAERENAYHQGTVWPWLLQHYVDTHVMVYKHSRLGQLQQIAKNFEQVINENGIGTISEIYDGNPPYTARGAISHAGAVAAVLRIMDIVESIENTKIA